MKITAITLICIALVAVVVVESTPRRKFVRRENTNTDTYVNTATHKHEPVSVPAGQELKLVHLVSSDILTRATANEFRACFFFYRCSDMELVLQPIPIPMILI